MSDENKQQSDFYVGYQAMAPAGLSRWLRSRLVGVVAICGLIVGAIAGAQLRFHDSAFAFGTTTTLHGQLIADPYPALLVTPELGLEHDLSASRVHIVGQGKLGANDALSDYYGSAVALQGTLIQRDQQVMLELIPTATQRLDTNPSIPGSKTVALGETTLRGEIVDSKCHLGVMKPGEGIAHRACAIRCISGGLPPMLVTQNAQGDTDYVLLTDADGQAFDQRLLPFVGRPLDASGELERRDDTLFMRVDVDALELL